LRLKYVKFRNLEKLENGTSTDEINSDIHGIVVYNEPFVHVGKDMIPIANVRLMRSAEKVTCPECQEEFADNRALGAHRSHVHNVKGKSRHGK
jgi:hypothetical protein